MSRVTIDRDVLKVVLRDRMIAINNDLDPPNRDKWGPIIPPTAIDWIADALVAAVVARAEREAESDA